MKEVQLQILWPVSWISLPNCTQSVGNTQSHIQAPSHSCVDDCEIVQENYPVDATDKNS